MTKLERGNGLRGSFSCKFQPEILSTINNLNNSSNSTQNSEVTYHDVSKELSNERTKISSIGKKRMHMAFQKNLSHGSLPLQDHFLYTVKKGDTLESIAKKFDMTLSLLKVVNRIYSDNVLPPCDQLKILLDSQEKNLDPINVYLFEDSNPTLKMNCDGKMMIYERCLIFKPSNTHDFPIYIHLSNHLDSAVVPHPDIMLMSSEHEPTDNDPYNLVINYLKQLDNKNSIDTICFKGKKGDLTKYYYEIIKSAEISGSMKNYNSLNTSVLSPKNKSTEFTRKDTQIKAFLTTNSNEPVISPRRKPKSNDLNSFQILNGKSNILAIDEINSIRKSLPQRFINHNWQLKYQLSTDGSCFNTFFSCAENQKPLVILIKTSKNEKIGAFVGSTSLHISSKYIGNGDTFVFTFHPDFKTYHWSSENSFFISASKDSISFGGGGASAIWIDNRLLKAFSEPCQTFKSPTLTSSKEFKICDVELWKISI
ncbi:TLD family protein [Tritrichomonas foetus]|uniref:Oxidation resistance protein 1 n=1 Tax=Tritrichomonas foetus TaxID=1144522 RepID=A0A1J4J4D1_9EUKA|nr:TLD family protein [Tritrichomonas foetus]|eukprot:OHS94218.1 TLD family protein [Tritrichomonas foetus]